MKPYYQDDAVTLYHADCRDILPTLGRFDLLLTDPPYGRVKGDFDFEWKNKKSMLGDCAEWRDLFVDRIKSNGTLYWFAWPSLAGQIEAAISEKFNVLSHIVWIGTGKASRRMDPTMLRKPSFDTDRIIMAEHYGSDNMARGETGYDKKCDEARGIIFEPIRKYICDEFDRAGMLNNEGKIAANVACGFSPSLGGMAARHYFSASQWQLPTEDHYLALRNLLNNSGEDRYLRREYEDLCREYEDLRRYFDGTVDGPKSDVWEFAPSGNKYGHPTEKPLSLISHMIRLSCRSTGIVLDPFAGSGTTGRAAKDLGRKCVLIEREEKYCEIAAKRMQQEVLF